MNMLLRLVIVLSVVRVASLFIFWPIGAVVSIILPFPLFGVGISYIASLAVALVAGWMAWKKFDATEGSLNSNVVLGALIFGSAGVVFGDAWSLSINPRNEDAIFGVFVFGFPAFALGSILGLVVGKRKYKAWDGLLWACAIATLVVHVTTVEYAREYNEEYQDKQSRFIRESTDLEKRDSTLKNLSVRSIADDDLIKLKRFKNLSALDFQSGRRSYGAKITDAGLKILWEMKLPKLGSLVLSNCGKITDEGMIYIAGMRRLRVIGLAACPQITDAGLRYLARSKSINTIDLRGCVGVTDAGLRYLEIMPKLKSLRLGGCTNITRRGIEELRKLRPDINVVKFDEEWENEGGGLKNNEGNRNVTPQQDLDINNSTTSNTASSIEREVSTKIDEPGKPLGSSSEYVGVWLNPDKKTLGVLKLVITKVGTQWRIQAWGACQPKNCGWGMVELYLLESSVVSKGRMQAFAEWNFEFMAKYMLIQLEGEQLHVQLMNVWNNMYAEGNSNYVRDYFLQRQMSQ